MHLRVNCQFKFWLLSCLKHEIILHEWKRWIHYAAQWVTNKECEVKYLTKYLHCPFNDPYKHLLTDSKISTSFWAILPYLLMEVMKVTVSMFYFPFMLTICHLNDINLKKKKQSGMTHTHSSLEKNYCHCCWHYKKKCQKLCTFTVQTDVLRWLFIHRNLQMDQDQRRCELQTWTNATKRSFLN